MNGLGPACKGGSECPIDQVCGTSKKCVSCEAGSKPDEDREKCEPTSMFYQIFSTTIKLTLIPLNGLGTECAKGTDCPTDQVCDASSNKCVACDEGTEPDDKQEKCSSNGESIFGDLFNVIMALLTLWIFFFSYF